MIKRKTLKKLLVSLLIALTLTLTACDFFQFGPNQDGNQQDDQQTTQPDSSKPDTDQPEQKPDSNLVLTVKEDNLKLGYPDEATMNNPTAEENYLIMRNSYALSYNNTTHNPNWVSWHLTKDDMGSLSRTDPWSEDTSLPESFGPRVEHKDYSNSGFSRGHMCPNAARNGEKTRQDETFIFTNIVPQVQNNNGGPWEKLESHIQSSCRSGAYEAYVISGPWGVGGQNNRGSWKDYIYVKDKKIKITVPAYTWKVFLVVESGEEDDATRINEGAKIKEAFGVWIPNAHEEVDLGDGYDQYKVSIDYIEEMTGYDFFSEINPEIQEVFESRYSENDPLIIVPTFYYEEPDIDVAA